MTTILMDQLFFLRLLVCLNTYVHTMIFIIINVQTVANNGVR